MRRTYPSFIINAACVCALAFAASACVSAEKREIFGESPIALVSFVVSDEVNWKGEGSYNVALAPRSMKRTLAENPDNAAVSPAVDFIDELEALVRSELEASPYINFAPAETVFASAAYAGARINSNQEKGRFATPSAYRCVYFRDNGFFPALAAETGVSKSLFITLEPVKVMNAGFGKNGNFRVELAMTVRLRDVEGRDLFYRKYELIGREHIDVSGGVYSQAGMRALVLSAAGDACYILLDELAY